MPPTIGLRVPASTIDISSAICGWSSSTGLAKACASQNPTTARLRDISSPEVIGFEAFREAMPKVASRPNGASAAREASRVGPPTISSTMSTF